MFYGLLANEAKKDNTDNHTGQADETHLRLVDFQHAPDHDLVSPRAEERHDALKHQYQTQPCQDILQQLFRWRRVQSAIEVLEKF